MALSQETVSAPLLRWYAGHRRDLPWRRDPTPYRVWISEIMLQQTQVDTVIPYYRRFLERFPDLESLAGALLEDVLPLWSGLGYYQRARNLHAAAKIVAADHGGRFPPRLEDALALPGIGLYTAGAILSIAYHQDVPVLDGNVERVLTRLLALPGDPRSGPNRARLAREAGGLIPPGRASDFNQALMELGALVCLPLRPACSVCPLESACLARAHGEQERFPEKPPRRKPVPVQLAVLILERRGRFLLHRPPRQGVEGEPRYLRGLWNFPTIELDGKRASEEAFARRLEERWGGKVALREKLGEARHSITFRKITATVYLGEWKRPPRRVASNGADRHDWRWAGADELGTALAVPSLALKALRLYARSRGSH